MHGAALRLFAQKSHGTPFAQAQDLPERFYRNAGVLNSREMARLLESRVFIAGCSVLGGHVAVLLAHLGIGALRLCDPDVFEESHLNRQCFCTEQTLSRPKVLACRDGLLGMASYMEIDAREVAADPENLPELLFCCDAVVNCLDSIPKKKMFEEAAYAKAFPLCLALFLATRALPSGPSQESCAYASPGRTHGQISESRLRLLHCFHWAAMRSSFC